MFATTPVFVQKNKKAFLDFLLERVNNFAEVCAGREWNPEMAWKSSHVDEILTEFSLGNIFFPFSNEQLLIVASWIQQGPKGDLFSRFSGEELVAVLGKEQSGKNIAEYFQAMITALKDWEECPRGYSNQNTSFLTEYLLDQILSYAGDPEILEITAEGEEDEQSEVESTTDPLEVEGEAEDGEEVEVEDEAEEEDDVPEEVETEVDEDEEPEPDEVSEMEEPEPPKKVTPAKTSLKIVPKSSPPKTKVATPKKPAPKAAPKPQGRYRIPQGPALKTIIESVIECTQPTKDLTPAQTSAAKTKLQEFSRTLDGQVDSLQGFVGIMMKRAIEICDPKSKPDNYLMSDIVAFVIDSLQ